MANGVFLKLRYILVVAVVIMSFPQMSVAQETFIEQDMAVLRTLDKVTARATKYEVDLNTALKFGSLVITVRTCQKTPPEEKPEAAAFLEIQERLNDEQTKDLFSGWMFASSPAVSALEHAVYDVWLLDCISPQTSATEGTEAESADKAQQQ